MSPYQRAVSALDAICQANVDVDKVCLAVEIIADAAGAISIDQFESCWGEFCRSINLPMSISETGSYDKDELIEKVVGTVNMGRLSKTTPVV